MDVAHAPYTMNSCAADPGLREFAQNMMRDDLARLEHTPGNYYNFHPGSHVQQGVQTGVALITAQLNSVLLPEQRTMVLLETMAGKGSEVGRTFEELRSILDGVALDEKMGVCLDTCHVWDGGYDIVNDLDGVLTQFDKTVGLSRLRAVHINDSMNPLGAHKDRHAKIGEGHIGFEAFRRIASSMFPYCPPGRVIGNYSTTARPSQARWARPFFQICRLCAAMQENTMARSLDS